MLLIMKRLRARNLNVCESLENQRIKKGREFFPTFFCASTNGVKRSALGIGMCAELHSNSQPFGFSLRRLAAAITGTLE